MKRLAILALLCACLTGCVSPPLSHDGQLLGYWGGYMVRRDDDGWGAVMFFDTRGRFVKAEGFDNFVREYGVNVASLPKWNWPP